MRHIENKTPELQSQLSDSFNIYNCLQELKYGIEYNLNNKYLTDDVKNLLAFVLDKLKQINQFVIKDVRFDYLILQNKIDELYRRDKSISGCHIKLDFNRKAKKEHYAYLTFNAVKS